MHAMITSNLNKIVDVCKQRHVRKLYAFGSVNTGHFNSQSDVDLLVEFDDIDMEEYADNYFDMCYELEDILNRKVDLVTVKSVHNPYFKKEIERTRQLIYAA